MREFKQQGLSLIELLISLTIGLVLFAGVLSIFVGMRTTTEETTSLGALQENGRFALSLLTDDLMRQGYWGGMAQQLSSNNLIANPRNPAGAAIPGDCIGNGINNESFPLPVGHFRSLWSKKVVVGEDPINCIDDAEVGSDILQLKRVIAAPVVGTRDTKRYYLNSNLILGGITKGADTPTAIIEGTLWEYQHHLYYVRKEEQGSETVPVLMQGYLRQHATEAIYFQPVIDGIEMIHFIYGIDTDNDGAVNIYLPSDEMLSDHWDNANNNQILSVKVYVLARDIQRDNNYTNNNIYTLGDVEFDANGDNYRRMLFSSTVTLYNSGVDSWQ